MKKVLVLLTSLGFAAASHAVTITYQGTANARPVDSNNNFLIDGALFKLGTFASDFNFTGNATNLSALNAGFTQFDSGVISTQVAGTNTRPGTLSDSISTLTNIKNTKLYIWIFNAATPETSSEWGIFTNDSATWLAAGDVPGDNLNSISLGNAGLIAKVGSTVINPNIASNTVTTAKLAVVAAVPEPSTYALMGLGLVVVGFLARRRK